MAAGDHTPNRPPAHVHDTLNPMTEPLIAYIERPINSDDLSSLATEPRKSKAPDLLRLSSRHHRLARLIAEGFSPGEAGTACNYVSSRVSILLGQDAFQELVNFYRAQVNAQYINLHERLSQISETAADIIQDRLEDNPDDFAIDDLQKIVKLGADRTGHGPSSSQNVNVSVGFAARLEAARERRRLAAEPITDAEIIEG